MLVQSWEIKDFITLPGTNYLNIHYTPQPITVANPI